MVTCKLYVHFFLTLLYLICTFVFSVELSDEDQSDEDEDRENGTHIPPGECWIDISFFFSW